MDINLGTGAIGFWAFAQQAPDELALIDPDLKEWTRGELLAEANKLVHGLREAGLQPGDVVAALLPNCAQFLAINLAVTQAGFFLVPLNWHLVGSEVAYILRDSEAKIFICHESSADSALAAIEEVAFPKDKVFAIGEIDGLANYSALTLGQAADMPEDRELGAVMFYTSGTTGKPKGVKRKLLPIDPDTSGVMYTMLLSLFGIEPLNNNVHYCGSPLYHTAVMNWSTSSLHMGHAVVIHATWDPEKMLEAVAKYQITTTHVVPTQMVRLQKLPRDKRTDYDLSSMTHMVHTAAPIAPDVKSDLMDWWGPCIYEYYAATEGGGGIATPTEWLANRGTVGKAWPGADIKVLDDNGLEVPAGEQGTVYMLMNDLSRFEYRGDQDKTREGRQGDYFTAGDIGYLNEDGFLFLCDRKIDMIISGGVNIYPAEIESVLITHPKIADCCVIGVPDQQWGEQVKAIVQAADGISAGETLTLELQDFLAARIAKMKLPKSIDYLAELPRDPNGKLYKRHLREQYWQDSEKKI